MVDWALTTGQLSYSEFKRLLDYETDWWIKKRILVDLLPGQFGPGTYRDVINSGLRAAEGETAMCAAARLVQEGVKLVRPYGDVHQNGKIILRNAKVIKSVGSRPSLIGPVLTYVLKRRVTGTPYDWPRFFGANHRHAEQMALFIKQSFETDVDAFLTRFDSFADEITRELFRRLIPGGVYPNYGSAVHNPTLIATLPLTFGAFSTLHNLRVSSITAHPRSLRTGAGTRRLRQSDYRAIRPSFVAALNDVETVIMP